MQFSTTTTATSKKRNRLSEMMISLVELTTTSSSNPLSIRSTGELVRWTIVICFCMLAIFTLTGLHHVQHTLDKDSSTTTQHYHHLQFVPQERSPSIYWLGNVDVDDNQQQEAIQQQSSEKTKPDKSSRTTTTCLEQDCTDITVISHRL